MIRSEVLTEFVPGTEQLLFPFAAEEFLRAGPLQQKILDQSEMARVVYEGDQLLCYAGVIRYDFIAPPLLWVLLGKDVNRWSARTFRKLTHLLLSIFPCVYTVVEDTHRAGRKFAEFCGFAPLGQFIEISGKRFEYYEVK